MKYCDSFLDILKSNGYTTCYFVAGGNIMHLLNSARTRFECIPVVHEVTATIATEYFNKTNSLGQRAFALVTAGPGLTNCITGIAGAYLESRELLVIGGQVKLADLKNSKIRQRGIQEIDGISLVDSITIKNKRLETILKGMEIVELISQTGRKGPIFIEFPIDLQAREIDSEELVFEAVPAEVKKQEIKLEIISEVANQIAKSFRPILLIGGGVETSEFRDLAVSLGSLGLPVMTTWNGTEAYGSDMPNYWGRPNTWGQRSSNIILQQCDFLLAVGTRLGLQQTGFNWEEFCPLAKVVQVDIDESELIKGHPIIDLGVVYDGADFLKEFINLAKDQIQIQKYDEWIQFGNEIRNLLPIVESNENAPEYVDPFKFVNTLSAIANENDVIIPCSSGGAFTVTMQAFETKQGQKFVTNKGLASMGYGLAGAIGAAQSTGKRTILIEGDGGFSQNLQELGTVVINNLNLKIFIFDNKGYASIRMTQINYFDGSYIGCDTKTGLGLPNWENLAIAYNLDYAIIDGNSDLEISILGVLESKRPVLAVVKIDPAQTYWPKITSHLDRTGNITSNPIHLMTPPLEENIKFKVFRYLNDKI